MQTKIVLATLSTVALISAGAGLGTGWMWWGSGAGAVEYHDSDADERLGDLRAGAMDRTDESDADAGRAADRASESGQRVAEDAGRISAEYRALGELSSEIAGGLAGDAELARQMADIIRAGAHPVGRGEVGDYGTAESSPGAAEHSDAASGGPGAE